MNLSHFVTRSAAVVALASLIGCSSSSTGSNTDYKASKNGCTVTMTGAVTVTNATCGTFTASKVSSANVFASLKDKPNAGDTFSMSANLLSFDVGSYDNGDSNGQAVHSFNLTTGGKNYVNDAATPGASVVKIDSSSDFNNTAGQLKIIGGSATADLYVNGDKTSTDKVHVVITF